MKQIRQPGFTIIEVVLFLAISALLAAGLMVGTSFAIQRQQYRDSVQSYANFLRTQYSRIIGVESNRLSDQVCPLETSSVPIGQSDCVVVGRYLATDDSGRKYTTFPIFALQDGAGWRYDYGDSDGEYELKWGVDVGFVGDDSGRHGIIMYRHPETGNLAVHYSSSLGLGGSRPGLGGFVNSSTYNTEEACIVSDGWMAGERQSVRIGAGAGSGDAITVGSASEGCAYYDETF